MNITKESDDYSKVLKLSKHRTKKQKALDKFNKYIKDNPCDMCSLKYTFPEACLTCDKNFE